MFRSTVRLLLVVGVFVALYQGVSHLFASAADGEGINLARGFLLEIRRSEALDLRANEIAQSMEVKTQIIDDLIAARLTLREAGEKFHDAATIVEPNREGLVPSYRIPDTQQERCRQVLSWTKSRLREKNTRKEAHRVQRRLRRQLKELLPNDSLVY